MRPVGEFQSSRKVGLVVLILTVILILGISGCAPTTVRPDLAKSEVLREEKIHNEMAVREIISLEQRIYQLYYPLALAAGPMCDDDEIQQEIGVRLGTIDVFGDQLKPAAKELLDSDQDGVIVFSVVPNSPADNAGIKDLDHLVSVNDIPANRINKSTLFQDGSVNKITVRRQESNLVFHVASETACNYKVRLVHSNAVNAYADGSNIGVNTGLIRILDENQIKLVLAHEIAHNIMDHIDAKVGNVLIGSLFDLVIIASTGVSLDLGALAGQLYSQEFESEADYVALYIMALADEPIDKTPDLWRRMSQLNPLTGNTNTSFWQSHPANPERYLTMKKTILEIANKRSSGEPLRPNLKP